MHREVDGCQVGRAGLCLCAIGFHGAPYAPPNVDLVRQFERNLEIVVGNAIECRAMRLEVGGCLGPGGDRLRTDRWKVNGPLLPADWPLLGLLPSGFL